MSNTTEYVGKEETSGNPFSVAKREESSGMLDVAASRAAQEVQAAMVIAKKFPRDEERAYERIMKSCRRIGLAEEATYAYPRGGASVTGPSIRLAEELARQWGNIECGIVELERREGESTAMAFAYDLQTNFRETKIFTVRHIRDKKGGSKELTDERDIYELVANMGSRRKRACILSVIPKDVADDAESKCRETVKKGVGSIEPVLKRMLIAFGELGINKAMIEKRLGHKWDATTPEEIVRLRGIFKSIEDGMSKRDDWFDSGVQEPAKPAATTAPATAPAKDKAPAVSAGQQLQDLLHAEGISFDRFAKWAEETGSAGDISSITTVLDLDEATATRLLKAKGLMLKTLKEVVA